MKNHFHLHLISDSTGETLLAASRAVLAQYDAARAVEHISSLVSTRKQLDRVLDEIDAEPGIVLYTIADKALTHTIDQRCAEMGVPVVNLLRPVVDVFQSYLGQKSSGRRGAQHTLDGEYFKRMAALNYTMAHDDGQLPHNIEEADVILIGVSRTSKTPTSIYLAQRGIKTVNVPLDPDRQLAKAIKKAVKPLVVALVASPDRIVQLRKNRILSFDETLVDDSYIDRATISEEIAYTRKLCKTRNWPMIDVSKRSIEEIAAEILSLFTNRNLLAAT
jgi:regulator of PEP synthase PpsR (kinase-PPPase family)